MGRPYVFISMALTGAIARSGRKRYSFTMPNEGGFKRLTVAVIFETLSVGSENFNFEDFIYFSKSLAAKGFP